MKAWPSTLIFVKIFCQNETLSCLADYLYSSPKRHTPWFSANVGNSALTPSCSVSNPRRPWEAPSPGRSPRPGPPLRGARPGPGPAGGRVPPRTAAFPGGEGGHLPGRAGPGRAAETAPGAACVRRGRDGAGGLQTLSSAALRAPDAPRWARPGRKVSPRAARGWGRPRAAMDSGSETHELNGQAEGAEPAVVERVGAGALGAGALGGERGWAAAAPGHGGRRRGGRRRRRSPAGSGPGRRRGPGAAAAGAPEPPWGGREGAAGRARRAERARQPAPRDEYLFLTRLPLIQRFLCGDAAASAPFGLGSAIGRWQRRTERRILFSQPLAGRALSSSSGQPEGSPACPKPAPREPARGLPPRWLGRGCRSYSGVPTQEISEHWRWRNYLKGWAWMVGVVFPYTNPSKNAAF